jgi:hypothetical protein
VVHGGLLAVLATVTWTVVQAPSADDTRIAIIGSEADTETNAAALANDLFATPSPAAAVPSTPRPDLSAAASSDTPPAPPPRSALTDASRVPRTNGSPGNGASSALTTAISNAGVSTGGGATQPAATAASFAGVRARAAARIVYVVDASGSMATSFDPPIVTALRASIARLSTDQRFQVILTRDRPGSAPDLATFADELVAPTPATLDALDRWLASVTTSGRADPRPGLLAALELEPDLVFVLTRSFQRSGAGADRAERIGDELLALLDQRNPVGRNGRRPAVIKTIQFVDPDPTGMLRQLSDRHGDGPGSHRLLTLDDLDRLNASGSAADSDGTIPDAELTATNPAASVIDTRTLELAERLGALEASGLAQQVLYGAPDAAQRARAVRDAGAVLERAGAQALTDPTASPARALMAVRASAIIAAAEGETPGAAALEAAERVLPTDPVAKAAHDALRLTLDRLAGRPVRPDLYRAISAARDGDDRFGGLSDTLPDEIVFERALAVLRAAPELGRPAFTAAGLRAQHAAGRDSARELLVAEAMTLGQMELADRPDPWLPMLTAWTEAWSAVAETVEPTVADLARMHRVAARIRALGEHPKAADLHLPGTVLFAAALATAVSQDSDARTTAIDLFARAAEQSGPHTGDALWERAALLLQDDAGASRADLRAGIDDLRRLANTQPDHPRAREAWTTAERLARPAPELHRALLFDAAANSSPAPGSLADRIRRAARAAAQPPALFEQALDLLERLRELDPAGPSQTTRRVLSSLWSPDRPIAQRERMLELADGARVPERGGWLTQHAARLEAPAQRLAVYDRILGIDPLDPANAFVPGGRPAVVLARARALDDASRRPEAFAELLNLTSAYDAAGIEPNASFWHAWTLILEWTAANPELSSRDAATARASLARLRSRDPALGGEPWSARLIAADDALSAFNP